MMKMQKLARHNSGLGGLSSSLFSEEDIMTAIFLWLPLKSLIRFKILSKRWYFLITDKDSYFRRNYLSTLSTRIRSDDDDDDDDDYYSAGIMAGFFYWKPLLAWKSQEPVRFLPTTSTQFKKYSFVTQFNRYSFLTEPKSSTPPIIINKMNPFLSFEERLDKFFSARLHEDEESNPSVVDDRKIFVAASSNGFLLCTLMSGFSHSIDFLVNPVTMEWLALPPLEAIIGNAVYLGFVCKGDYPSLDLVEYTVVRLSCLGEAEGGKVDGLLFQLLSSSTTTGDNNNNEWIEYRVSSESLQVDFGLCGQIDTVIVSNTTTNNQGGGGGGGGGSRRILVYFLVMVRLTRSTAIAAIELNEGDDPSLRMFETPGPDRGKSVFCCADYIRGFDDGRVIHYVRILRSTDFEFWVFNPESGEWYLRHRARLETMMLTKGYPWTNVMKWQSAVMVPKPPYVASACYHIHAFHPMNPDLIFLTLYGKFACYNVKTGMLELVYDFDAKNMKDDFRHFVYQWPCWPPLL